MKKRAAMIWVLTALTFCGCSRPAVTSEDTEGMVSDNNSRKDSSNIFLGNYEKKYYENRVKISEYKDMYEVEAEELKSNPTEKLSFASCEFGAMETSDEISVLRQAPHNLSEEESWQVIEDWLKEIGVADLDMDKEVRDASGQYDRDESKEYPYDYAAVSEHRSEFEKGDGFFVNTNECYLQMGGDGMYSMSDGTITRYLKSDSFAAMDALGVNAETIVKEGKLKDLENETWELLSGKVTVNDAADVTKKYFEAGTPYPCTDGVTVDIPRVSVFAIDDKYGYAFVVRRKYRGIPFVYTEGGGRNYYEGGYDIKEDMKTAYVVGDETVNAFTGYSEACPLEPIGKAQDSIISLKEAVSILNEKLAMRLNVDVADVELAYYVAAAGDVTDEDETFAAPCWSFDGVNSKNEEGMRIYLDAFTGELYYYTYYIVEQ